MERTGTDLFYAGVYTQISHREVMKMVLMI